ARPRTGAWDVGAYQFAGGALPPAPVITSAASATGTVGTAFSYQITATNSPTSYSATGLPAGLSVNPSNGLIPRTPTAAGNSSLTLSAANAGGTGTATLVLTISASTNSHFHFVRAAAAGNGSGSDWTK